MKSIRHFILLIIFMVILTSCSPASAPEAGPEPEPAVNLRPKLIIATANEPDILDIQQAWNDYPESTGLICQPLARFDETKSGLVPDLAESWEIVEDGKNIIWKLPEGAQYSNGDTLDAQALADAWWRYKTISPYAEDLAPIVETNVIDASTLEAIHDNPPAFMLAVLVTCYGAPYNAAAAEEIGDEAFSRNPIGSGPLQFKEWLEGSEIVFSRNENYQTNLPFVENKGPLHLEEVVVRFIPEDLTRASELEAGTVDVVVGLPSTSISDFQDNPDVVVLQGTYPGYRGLVMNMLRAPFDDVKVRAAIAMAVDRDAFVNVLEGTVAPQFSVITPAMVGYSPEMEQYAQDRYPFDPEGAKALLSEAGWADSDGDGIVEKDGMPFELTFLVPSDESSFVKVAPVIQEQLKAIGIKVNLEELTFNTIFDMQVAGEYDMSVGGYGWSDPDILVYVVTDQGWNRAHYQNEELLPLLEEARYIMDVSARTKKYEEVQQILIDDVVEIPLWTEITYVGVRTWVQDFIMDGNLNIYLNDVTVIDD